MLAFHMHLRGRWEEERGEKEEKEGRGVDVPAMLLIL